jgi:methylated-DNA-[protein]-cysteine S-methyltransferase
MEIIQPGYSSIETQFGPIAVIWWNSAAGPRVRQIFLCGRSHAAGTVGREFPGARPGTHPKIDDLCGQIHRFLKGQAVVFDLGLMAMEVCGDFQRKVLTAEYGIPRSWVSTYGRLARHIGAGSGGRAAGRALATNPFPIVIPCHRAVRSDGEVGGYQGGSRMKRTLLEMEGVEFDARGRVMMEKVYY